MKIGRNNLMLSYQGSVIGHPNILKSEGNTVSINT